MRVEINHREITLPDMCTLSEALAREGLDGPGKAVAVNNRVVPKESSYGLLYNLAKSVGSRSDKLLKSTFPPNPYPIELVRAANWRTTSEKVGILEKCGFVNLKYQQTLTRHPLYSDEGIDQPVDGYDKGDYVAIIGFKPV